MAPYQYFIFFQNHQIIKQKSQISHDFRLTNKAEVSQT